MLLSVPNFSEGRDPSRIASLRAVLAERVEVLDRHSDREHHRSVFTVAGEEADLVRALGDAVARAAELIDMSRHRGLHPCIGATDVCPIVWRDPAQRKAARQVAFEVADQIAELGIPVFLYGELATTSERVERAFFRRGGLEELSRRMEAGELRPDRGPARPHSRAGATLVTARPPLAAFNVEVAGLSLEQGREIAARIRESGGGPEGLRAIALPLEDRGLIQISTNIHDPFELPLGEVVELVRHHAEPLGARPVASEIIGLVPAASLKGYPADVPIRDRDDSRQTIEGRLG
jgi:glutamate formiminotransferase